MEHKSSFSWNELRNVQNKSVDDRLIEHGSDKNFGLETKDQVHLQSSPHSDPENANHFLQSQNRRFDFSTTDNR